MALEITENNMADQILPEMQDITRQRDLARLLLQRGMADNLQGQMVSGRYVGASPLQGIANIYSAYKGGKMSKEADRKQQELAQILRTAGVQESQDILSTMRGRQAVPEVIPQGQTLLDDQGMPTMGAQRGVAGVTPDLESAYAKAIGSRSPQGQALAPMLAKQLMREPKFEKIEQYDPKTGNTMVGMIDVNSPNPEATYRPVGVSKPAMSQKDILELRDRGINVGGGIPTGGVAMGGGQGGGQVTGDAKYLPANLPTYEYNPRLSPQQNRELAGKFEADLQKNVKNAKSAFNAIKNVSEILGSNAPSSGRGENIITGVREFFGRGGEASKTDAQLKVLEQQLVQQVPRFEGPQSDKDVASYKAAAGDVGNPNIPIASRMGALQVLIDLNKKYYPNGDWDSINLNPPNIKPNMLGGTNTYFGATVQARQLAPQDQEALNWANSNPNDPRSAQIKQRLGR
jgi:hypothetical protein